MILNESEFNFPDLRDPHELGRQGTHSDFSHNHDPTLEKQSRCRSDSRQSHPEAELVISYPAAEFIVSLDEARQAR